MTALAFYVQQSICAGVVNNPRQIKGHPPGCIIARPLAGASDPEPSQKPLQRTIQDLETTLRRRIRVPLVDPILKGRQRPEKSKPIGIFVPTDSRVAKSVMRQAVLMAHSAHESLEAAGDAHLF